MRFKCYCQFTNKTWAGTSIELMCLRLTQDPDDPAAEGAGEQGEAGEAGG